MTFFKENSYNIVKMMLYQFGMMIFGLIVTMAASKSGMLQLTVSIYATLMYVALLYMMTWDCGAKDHIRVNGGYIRADRLSGLKMSLMANIPNFIILFFLLLGYLFGVALSEQAWAQGMFIIAHGAGVVFQAMYTGIVNTLVPPSGSALSGMYLVAYLLTPLPSIAASCFGYEMGWRERRLFGFLSGKNKKNGK